MSERVEIGPHLGDRIIERTSQRLRQLAEQAGRRGGLVGKLAQPLAEDAAFVRKLRPSLIKARAKGEPHRKPTSTPATPASAAPQAARGRGGNAQPDGGGHNPLPLIGAALGAGVATAKLLDWRGHAHPRA